LEVLKGTDKTDRICS